MNPMLIISKQEYVLVKKLIESSPAVDPGVIKSLRKLYDELKVADIRDLKEIPHTVVKLNSIVTVNTSYGRKVGLQLVMPEHGDLKKRKLSVTSSMGSALLGYKEGDHVMWSFPNGDEMISIEKVQNP